MKVSLNLATLSTTRERYALVWAIPLTVFGLVGLAAFSFYSITSYSDYKRMDASLNTLTGQEKALKTRETDLRKDLDMPPQRAVFQKAHYINGLIEQKQFSIAVVTEKVSKLLPSAVRLTSLGVSRPKGEVVVRFSVVGHDEDALEAFMGKLEDSTDFTDLNISNQGPQQASLSSGLAGIVCTARYVGEGSQ